MDNISTCSGEALKREPADYDDQIEGLHRAGTGHRGKLKVVAGHIRYLLALLACLIFAYLRMEGFVIFASSPRPSVVVSLVESENAIHWMPCGENLECGRLEVPLDYTNMTPGLASLAVIRYPVKDKKARLGTILVNPGGPGDSGLRYVRNAGQSLQILTGGRHDIVSWDPRGVHETEPSIRCFDTQFEQDMFLVNTQDVYPPSAWNYSDPVDIAIYSSQYRIAEAQIAVEAALCNERSGDILPFIGTTTAVRDMERLYRAIEGDDEPVNYWGFSYGTMIGSYFVNMFPERVGRVVIDGVLNPVAWANINSYERAADIWPDIEKVLYRFYEACAEAGAERCALASNSSSAASLAKEVDNFLAGLFRRPLPVSNATKPGILTEGLVKGWIFPQLFSPRHWPQLASSLVSAMKGDGAPILDVALTKVELDKTVLAETHFAVNYIRCGDGPEYDGHSDEAMSQLTLEALLEVGRTTTSHFGPSSVNVFSCHHWSKYVQPKERFTGPFNHSLSNVMLVIGNTADPVTPLVDAMLVNSLLPNSSRLVIQDGSGHTSSSQTSLCTIRTVMNYFLEGTLPMNGTVCAVDEQTFPSHDGLALRNGLSAYSSGDIELAKAVRHIADNIMPLRL